MATCFFISCNFDTYKLKYHKKDELKKILEGRGLIIYNPNILNNINYSHLIYEYGAFFLETEEPIKYKKGTKLLDIYNLYKLNIEVSSILFKLFNLFEHKIRASIVSHVGLEPLEYLDDNFYSKARETVENEIFNFVSNLSKTEEKMRHKYDQKYLINGKLPIWLLIDELPIGQLRMFLKLTGIQSYVFKDIKLSKKKFWVLKGFNLHRNQLAHMDIIKGKISKDGNKYYLMDLLNKISENFKKEYLEASITIKETIKEYNFNINEVYKFSNIKK